MRRGAIIFFIWILFYSPISFSADHITTFEELERISDEALQMVKTSRYEDARRLLEFLSDEFMAYTMNYGGLSQGDSRILSLLSEEALEAVADSELQHEEKLNRVTRLRLALDAVSTSTGQPLWTEMKEPMMLVLQGVEEAILSQDTSRLHSQLNSFLSLYDVIYPSLKLDVPIERLQKIDTRVVFLDQYRSQLMSDIHSQNELLILRKELQALFDQLEEDEADPSLWWVIIMTGSIIIVTLSYVGWKKYKGEREKERERRRRRERGNLIDSNKRDR